MTTGIDFNELLAYTEEENRRWKRWLSQHPETLAVTAGIAGEDDVAGLLVHIFAAESTLPVIGVPIPSSALQGMDSLLATVQMPAGIPVATVAIGKAGATNAGILAAQMLALSDPELAKKLHAHKDKLAKGVEEKSKKLKESAR